MPVGGQPGNNNAGKNRPITEAIIAALNREMEYNGEKTKRLLVLAEKLAKRACEDDDNYAINHILERVEGKPTQEREVNVRNSGTITHKHQSVSTALDFLAEQEAGDTDGDTEGVVSH